ncbi:MAG: 1-(5-phosphoribosyl)-5-[(5-phosphoribosylamino)methylideneamino]imidazole-4-carboxamide isomerase [Actinobacteria bacterium]|nr:1-(5-phosphoribosyl)-5-[(5-phosphoribosylamino)methylideneamino]imidazole-4-carboxamide isomerase [Actinomycetota bacterium]
MIVIPAIDIMEGNVVRLTKGDFSTKKVYYDDPLKAALRWKESGAQWLHIIDLDGAKTGKVANLGIASMIKNELGIRVQYGGGIRNKNTLNEVISSGIDRAILGTGVLEDDVFLKECLDMQLSRIIISLDYDRKGIVFKNGWQSSTRMDIFGILKKLKKSGMEKVIITDISRDGTMKGANFTFLKEIMQSTSIRFIVAGGIRSLDDIRMLKKIEHPGVEGVIVGKALYEEQAGFDLKEAIRIGGKDDNQENYTLPGCK